MDEVKAGKLRWRGLAWVGAISESAPDEGGNGRWVWKNDRDTEIEPGFFEENEMDDGQYFGALPLPKNPKKGADGNYAKGGLCSMASFDWKVQGLIMESRPNFSSSYTFNGWVLNDFPRMNGAEEGKFFSSLEEGGSGVPLFSEGTGPMIMPDASDRPAADLRMGGQTGQGLSRITINRYFNGANNVAFMDGSVENVKLPDLWELRWHREWEPPGRLPEMPED
jgi:prepilin-type processing-associated H-X9-DG protein